MKKGVILSGLALFAMSTIASAASLQSLTKDQVNQMIGGKTLTTIPLVTMNQELMQDNPVTFTLDKQGKITGQFANKPATDPQTDEGTWMVKPTGTTCVTWQHWNNAKPICVNIFSLNNTLIFVNQDTQNFESMVLKTNIR